MVGNWSLSVSKEMKLNQTLCPRPQFFQNNCVGRRCAEGSCVNGIAGLVEVPNVMTAIQ